jgi:hypothetical protein
MTSSLELLEEENNPLDNVEDVLSANNWSFNRMTEDELVVNVTGRSGQYRLFFIWQDDMQALQFCAQYDLTVQENNLMSARVAISAINESMWMGHFDLPTNTCSPTFRYTCLFKGNASSAITEMVEDIVDISMAQCERYFSTFQMLSSANDVSDKNLSLALMETAGES